jgi:hypothetical protein
MGNCHKLVRASLPKMALKGRLTSATSNRTLSMRKFSDIPNVTGREIHPRRMIGTRPTPKNGRDGWSFNISICSFLKADQIQRCTTVDKDVV